MPPSPLRHIVFIGQLEPNTQYFIKVQAENNGIPSNALRGTQATLPAVGAGSAPVWPTGATLGIAAIPHTRAVRLTWPQAGGTIREYQVWWGKDESDELTEANTHKQQTPNLTLDVAIPRGVKRNLWVKAVNAHGDSGWLKNHITLPANANVPLWPEGSAITFERVLSTSISISWDEATSATPITYYYAISTDPEFTGVELTPYAGNDRTLIFNNLPVNTEQHIRIVARNASGDSLPLDASRTTLVAPPHAPIWEPGAEITLWGETTDGFIASWDAAQQATGYHYQLATDANFNTIIRDESTAETQVSLSPLNSNTRFWFRVQAENDGVHNGFLEAKDTYTLRETLAPAWPAGAEISASNVGTDRFTIRWPQANGPGDMSYRIERATDENFRYNKLVIPKQSGRVVHFDNLDPDTDYWTRVMANNGRNAPNWLTKKVRTDAVPAQAPAWPNNAALTITGIQTNQFTINFPAATSGTAVTYHYKVSDDIDFAGVVEHPVPAGVFSHPITGLDANTLYHVRLVARNSTGDSIPLTASDTTSTEAITAPSWPPGASASSSDETETTIKFSWTAATGATSYAWEFGTSRQFRPTLTRKNTTPNTEIEFDTLPSGTEHFFQVWGVNAGGRTPTALSASGSTLADTPDLPKPVLSGDLTLTPSANPPAIQVDWEAATGTVSHYRIEWSTSSSFANKKSLDLPPTQTSHTLSEVRNNGIMLNTRYFVRLYAVNDTGESDPIVGNVTTPPPKPNFLPGAKVTISNIHSDGFSVAWPAATGAPEHYGVAVWSKSPLALVKHYEQLTDRNVEVTGLQAGKAYIVLVVAHNAGGAGTGIHKEESTTAVPTSLPVVSGVLTFSNVSSDEFRVAWDAATGEVREYHVEFATESDFGDGETETTTLLYHDCIDLEAETLYYVRVWAENAAGRSVGYIPNQNGATQQTDAE